MGFKKYKFSLIPTIHNPDKTIFTRIIEGNTAYSIGRHSSCTIIFHPHNLIVSAKHCRFIYTPNNKFLYIYVSSKNGIYVNDQRINQFTWCPIPNNARIRISNPIYLSFNGKPKQLVNLEYTWTVLNLMNNGCLNTSTTKYYLPFNQLLVHGFIRKHYISHFPLPLSLIILNLFSIPIYWKNNNDNKSVTKVQFTNAQSIRTNLAIPSTICFNFCTIKRWTIQITNISTTSINNNNLKILFGATNNCAHQQAFSNNLFSFFAINLCDGIFLDHQHQNDIIIQKNCTKRFHFDCSICNDDLYIMEWNVTKSIVRYYKNNTPYGWIKINGIQPNQCYVMAIAVSGLNVTIQLMDFTETLQ